MFVIIIIMIIIATFMWLIIYGGNASKTDTERFLEDTEEEFSINKDKNIYRRIYHKLDEEYVENIKNLTLTEEQEKAYRQLTEYNLTKVKELYDTDYYNRLCEEYYWLMVSIIKEDKIIEYVQKYCK